MLLHCALPRSDLAWKKCFTDAGLKVIQEEIQNGFPEGLYPVKMWVPPILSLDTILVLTRHAGTL